MSKVTLVENREITFYASAACGKYIAIKAFQTPILGTTVASCCATEITSVSDLVDVITTFATQASTRLIRVTLEAIRNAAVAEETGEKRQFCFEVDVDVLEASITLKITARKHC